MPPGPFGIAYCAASDSYLAFIGIEQEEMGRKEGKRREQMTEGKEGEGKEWKGKKKGQRVDGNSGRMKPRF